MAKKKLPGGPARRTLHRSLARVEAPKDLQDAGLGPPPQSEDPSARAEYFLQMLDAFAVVGTPEAKRIRSELIGAISEFGEARKENLAEAQKVLEARLVGMEIGVLQVITRTMTRMRDQIREQARRLGKKSPAGKNAHMALEGITHIVESLETMMRAAAEGDRTLRDEAGELMRRAREVMMGLG